MDEWMDNGWMDNGWIDETSDKHWILLCLECFLDAYLPFLWSDTHQIRSWWRNECEWDLNIILILNSLTGFWLIIKTRRWYSKVNLRAVLKKMALNSSSHRSYLQSELMSYCTSRKSNLIATSSRECLVQLPWGNSCTQSPDVYSWHGWSSLYSTNV